MSGYRNKEACVIVVDATVSDSDKSLRFPTYTKFQLVKKLADHYVRRFLEESRKTDEVGIVVLGEMGEEQDGANEVLQIQSASVEHRRIIEAIEPQVGEAGDFDLANAFKLAADKIAERVKHYKYKRTIVLVTDGASIQSLKALKDVKEEFEQAEMTSVEVLGVDFDVDTGRSEECMDGQKTLEKVIPNEKIKAVAPENAFRPHKRQVGQVKKFQGEMEVSSYCKFYVIMVARVAEERLKSLEKRSKLALDQVENEGGDADEAFQTGDAGISMDRKYISSENPAEEREVPPEERSRGFRYGKDILPMGPADEEAMRLEETLACLKVIGIIDRSQLLRNYMISPTNCIVAHPDSAQSQEGFSAFVRAMRELDKVATCRYVRKDGTNPKFIALIPGHIPEGSPAAGGDCLWHVLLPTVEDLRDYSFESLAKFVPNDVELAAAEDYVAAMTLVPGDAKESHRYDPEFTCNPVIARYWDALHVKALEPDRPLPQASPFITAMISTDPNVVKRARKPLRNFTKAFPLRRMVRKRDTGTALMDQAAGQGAVQTDGSAAGGNIASRIAAAEEEDGGDWFDNEPKSIVEFVGTMNPVEDFNAMLKGSVVKDLSQNAFQQIAEVALKLYREGNIYFEKVMECIQAFREGALMYHGESSFNKFLTAIKAEFLQQGPTNPMWERLVQSGTTVISNEEANGVEVTPKEARDFLSVPTEGQGTTQVTTQSSVSQTNPSDDDLFDSME